MNKLLWVGNVPSHIGGQNRVAYFSIKELIKLGWQVAACGKGVQVLDSEEESPCQVFNFNENDPQTLYDAIDLVKPDVLLFSHDCWLFYFLPELREKYPHIAVVGWFTIDAHPIHRSWIPIFRACDRLVVPTDFGKQTIYERFPEKVVDVIKYGVEKDVYKMPDQTRAELKTWFLTRNLLPLELKDYCFFTFIGNNQIKKNLGAMVDAFQSANMPKSVLLLAVKSITTQIGSFQFDGEYDLHDMIAHPNIYVVNSLLDHDTHAKFMQMSEYFLYPSQGEAPGLQMAESQLCGSIPIATNYTGMPEETCYPGMLIDNFQFHRGQFNCYRAMVSAEALREKMEKAYNFWEGCGDQPEYQTWKDSCQKLIEKKFKHRTWKDTAEGLNRVLLSAVKRETIYDPEILAI